MTMSRKNCTSLNMNITISFICSCTQSLNNYNFFFFFFPLQQIGKRDLKQVLPDSLKKKEKKKKRSYHIRSRVITLNHKMDFTCWHRTNGRLVHYCHMVIMVKPTWKLIFFLNQGQLAGGCNFLC